MTHMSQQRPILLKNRLPIIAVKLRIVKVLALNAPRLAINLFPFGARIDLHFQLRDVDWSVADLDRSWPIGRHDSPTGSAAGAGLIEKLLLVIRKRVRANAFEDRRGRALFELISLQAQRWRYRRCRQDWFSVVETSGGARGNTTVVTGMHVHRQ